MSSLSTRAIYWFLFFSLLAVVLPHPVSLSNLRSIATSTMLCITQLSAQEGRKWYSWWCWSCGDHEYVAVQRFLPRCIGRCTVEETLDDFGLQVARRNSSLLLSNLLQWHQTGQEWRSSCAVTIDCMHYGCCTACRSAYEMIWCLHGTQWLWRTQWA